MRRRVAAARVGRLATVAPDGRPRVRPVTFALVGADLFTAVDDVKRKSGAPLRRLAEVAATGWAELVVDHYEDDWRRLWWVRVAGPAEVFDANAVPDAIDALAAKYPQYAERRPPGPVIRVRGERWSGWSA